MRRRSLTLLLPALAALLLLSHCENSFTPKSPFRPQLVVFCVLNAADSTQVVRLAKSYDADVASKTVPLTSVEVDSAVVSIKDSKRVYAFSDTLVASADGGMQRVWVSRALHPQTGQPYTLTISVPGFDPVSVEARLPGRLYPWLKNEKSEAGVSLLRVQPGYDDPRNVPYGYYYRMWIVCTRNDGGPPDQTRAEVPAYYSSSTGEITWPVPTRSAEAVFPVPTIEHAYAQLRGSDTLFIKKELVVKAFAFNESFYLYYKTARGFDDQLSLRIDQPNLTFIPGGLGVFGAVNIDSARFNYSAYVK